MAFVLACFSYSFLSAVLSLCPHFFFKLSVRSLEIILTRHFIEITGIDFEVWWYILSVLPGPLFSYQILRLESAFSGFFFFPMTLWHVTVFTVGEWGRTEILPSGTMIFLEYALHAFPNLGRIMAADIIFWRFNTLFYLHIWKPRGLVLCV